MRNLFKIILILALIASCAYTEEKTCQTHDIFLKVKEYLNARGAEGKDKDLIADLITKYEANTPAVADEASLGVCKQFASQKSCCNKDITDIIEQLGQIRVRNIAKSGNGKKGDIFFRIATILKNIMVRQDCSGKGKTQSSTEDSIQEVASDSDKGKVLKEKIQLGQIKLNKALSSLTRGAICAICSGVDQISTYLVDGKIQISQSSSTAFKDAADAALDAINTASDPTSAEFKEAITAIVTEISGDSKCTDFALKKIEEVLAKQTRIDKSQCQSTQLLPASGSEGDCEKSSKGPDDLESQSQNLRFLITTATTDAEVSSSGINVYLTSALDDNLAADGSSSSRILQFAGMIILSVLLFL